MYYNLLAARECTTQIFILNITFVHLASVEHTTSMEHTHKALTWFLKNFYHTYKIKHYTWETRLRNWLINTEWWLSFWQREICRDLGFSVAPADMKMIKGSLVDNLILSSSLSSCLQENLLSFSCQQETCLANVLIRCSSPPQGDDWWPTVHQWLWHSPLLSTHTTYLYTPSHIHTHPSTPHPHPPTPPTHTQAHPYRVLQVAWQSIKVTIDQRV